MLLKSVSVLVMVILFSFEMYHSPDKKQDDLFCAIYDANLCLFLLVFSAAPIALPTTDGSLPFSAVVLSPFQLPGAFAGKQTCYRSFPVVELSSPFSRSFGCDARSKPHRRLLRSWQAMSQSLETAPFQSI